MLAMMVSALAAFGLASLAPWLRAGPSSTWPCSFAGGLRLGRCSRFGSALLPLRTAASCGLERLVLRRLRIEGVERGADVGAVGELAEHVGRVGRLLVEIDRAAHPRERHAADAGVAREGDDGIGQRQLVGGELGRIGVAESRRRIVRRIEAVGRHALQEGRGLLGARARACRTRSRAARSCGPGRTPARRRDPARCGTDCESLFSTRSRELRRRRRRLRRLTAAAAAVGAAGSAGLPLGRLRGRGAACSAGLVDRLGLVGVLGEHQAVGGRGFRRRNGGRGAARLRRFGDGLARKG